MVDLPETLIEMTDQQWYSSGMKVKTSVTLSQELLDAIENELRTSNRSAILEEAAWEFLRSRRRAARDAGELRLLNEAAASLNDEALDTLDYQDIE
jgi:metal-responsive CopG/Arc/MetJ family transcriptional regulator